MALVVSKSASWLISVLCVPLAWTFMWTQANVSMLERFCTVSVSLKIAGLYWTPLSTWSLLSAAQSRNADTMAHPTLCACRSADWPRKRRVEIWTENVIIGQEPDSDELGGSGPFCIECEACSVYTLPPLSGPTPCAGCEHHHCEMLWCEALSFLRVLPKWKSCTSDYCACEEWQRL